jgi:hypothetical protein
MSIAHRHCEHPAEPFEELALLQKLTFHGDICRSVGVTGNKNDSYILETCWELRLIILVGNMSLPNIISHASQNNDYSRRGHTCEQGDHDAGGDSGDCRDNE